VFFPLGLSDVSLFLAVTAIILLVTSEYLYALPEFAATVALDKAALRMIALGCGLGFGVTVVMRIMGYA